MSLKSYQSFKNPVNFSFWRISMKFLHNVVLYKHSLKNIFWQFSYPYGYLIYEVTTYYYGRTIQLQILLMVFKCYIWGLPWKYYGISISFQSQKWIRLVIKRLLPNNLWYWWLYQSSKVKNCDISKCQKWWLNRSSIGLFICILMSCVTCLTAVLLCLCWCMSDVYHGGRGYVWVEGMNQGT